MSIFPFRVLAQEPVFRSAKGSFDIFLKDSGVKPTKGEYQALLLCLVEGIQNARIHGGKSQEVSVRLEIRDGGIEGKIWDHNPPFVLSETLSLPADPYAEHGRGMVLIKEFSDTLSVSREGDGNCVSIFKKLAGLSSPVTKTHLAEKDSAKEEVDPLQLLYEMSEIIVQENEVNFDRIYQLFLDKAVSIFGVDRASIMNFDADQNVLRIVASRGLSGEVVENTTVKPGEGISGQVFQNGAPVLFDKKQSSASATYKSNSFISAPMLCSPMRMGGTCMGVINITERSDGRPFSEKDLRLLTTLANQAAAYLRIANLIEQVKESERIGQEMAWARRIQNAFLPQGPVSLPQVDLYGHCEMAQQVGGDYIDYMLHPPYLYLVVADVSGHNLPAALTMVNFRSLLRSQVSIGGRPKEILERVNRLIYDDLLSNEQHITVALMRLDLANQTLVYSHAGHHPILYLKKGASAVERLFTDGILLGAIPELIGGENEMAWNSGDSLLFYTDGIVEARNARRRPFGQQALEAVWSREIKSPPKHIVESILADVRRHIGEPFIEHSDDLTLMHVYLK